MKLHSKFWPLLFFLISSNLACSLNGTGTPQPVATLAVDGACKGIVGFTFVSSSYFELGEGEQGQIFGPYIVTFLNDGRVYWRYSLDYFIGTFECQNGVIKTTFAEGERKSFEGIYNFDLDTISINSVNYSKAPNQ